MGAQSDWRNDVCRYRADTTKLSEDVNIDEGEIIASEVIGVKSYQYLL